MPKESPREPAPTQGCPVHAGRSPDAVGTFLVGECGGGEALDMLQAMNAGHEGSLPTGHANGVDDALSRLEALVTKPR
ncbi:MAG: ATPase, T2SS/T4P/T4SS family [Propioniciclava sp.]